MLDICHEPITYAPGRATAVPPDAGFFAVAFEPEALEQALPELARRTIPHSNPFTFAVTYRDDPEAFALDERVGPESRRRRWTLVTLGGLLGDPDAQELSRWPRRAGAPGGRMLGRLLGRLASGWLGGVLMARMGSTRPFCFLCEFHSFDVADARATAREELTRRGGRPLGLVRTHEIVIEARNLGDEERR